MIVGSVAVVVVTLLAAVALFFLQGGGSGKSASALAAAHPSASPVPNASVPPAKLWERAKAAVAKQDSVRMLSRIYRFYEIQYLSVSDGQNQETTVNFEGQLLRVRNTPQGVFSYIANQMIGVRKGAGGYWVRYTEGVEDWRQIHRALSAQWKIAHTHFDGAVKWLGVRHRNHQTVLGIGGHLVSRGKHARAAIWLSPQTLLPVQYVTHWRGHLLERMDFSQWGQADHVHAPKHWVDKPLAPPTITGSRTAG